MRPVRTTMPSALATTLLPGAVAMSMPQCLAGLPVIGSRRLP